MQTDDLDASPEDVASPTVLTTPPADLPYPAGNDDINAKVFFDDVLAEFGVENINNKIAIITVNHLVNTLVHFLPALSKIGRVLGVVAKSSSTTDTERLKAHLTESGFQFLPWTKKIIEDNPQQIIDEIMALCKTDEKLVIIDIGGYFSPCVELFSIDPRMKDKLLGIVEDTENGHQKYEKVVKKAAFPILSVARSLLKDTEDFNVGKSIVNGLDTILRTDSHQILERVNTVGVIGYGKIGSSCAQHLKEKGIRQILVCELNPIRAQMASSRGFRIVSHDYLLQSSELIISATGAGGIRGTQFEQLKDNVFVASVTSADDEFDLSNLEEQATQETVAGNIYTFTLANKKLNLLCRGNAVNFVYNAVVGPFIYSVQAELMVCALQLIKGHHAPKTTLIEMHLQEMQRIAAQWLNTYENLPESESALTIREHFTQLQNPITKGIFTAPEPNPHFSGRQKLLLRLQELLTPEENKPYTRCSISGIGGAGKTELAIKLAWNVRQEYAHVCYILAETIEVIQQCFINFSNQLGIKLDPTNQKQIMEFYQTLRSSGRTLIIFDNVNSLSAILNFLPPKNIGYNSRDFSVIITTRHQRINREFTEVLLDPDEHSLQQDAIDYIIKNTNCAAEAAQELADKLQHLALALSQAVAYINAHAGCTVKKYLALFEIRQTRMQLLAYVPLEEKYKQTVLTTWLISFESLDDKSKKVLQLCAHLFPDNISIALLELKADYEPAIINSLLQYSLIYSASSDSIKIHRLIQEVTRETMEHSTGTATATETAINLLAQYARYKRSNIIRCMESIAHYNMLLSFSGEEVCLQAAGYGDLIFQLALFYLDYEYAAELAERLLKTADKLFGTEDFLKTLKIKRHLAKAYTRLNKLPEAEAIYVFLETNREHMSTDDYLNILLDKYYFLMAKKEDRTAKEVLDHAFQTCTSPSSKARCLYYLANWNQAKCNYLEKAIEGKQNDLDKLPSWQSSNREKKQNEITTCMHELSTHHEDTLRYLNGSLAIKQSQRDVKEIIRSTLQLCRAANKCKLPVYYSKAVLAIIDLYRRILEACDPVTYKRELTESAICLSMLYATCTPDFERHGAAIEFKEVLVSEKKRIQTDYGTDSPEYKAMSAYFYKKQKSINDFLKSGSSASKKEHKRSLSTVSDTTDDAEIKRRRR